MNNIIFHTSKCGSTLLSSLISKSINSYAEPPWSHFLYKHGFTLFDSINHFYLNYEPNSVVKLSSVCCYMSNILHGKKVFLFHPLYHHLLKLSEDGIDNYLSFFREIMIDKISPEIRHICETIEIPSPTHELALYWLDRVIQLSKVKNDIIWIEANTLFSNPYGTAKVVCDHFGVEYIPEEINYHVKKQNTLHNPNKIELIEDASLYETSSNIVIYEKRKDIDDVIDWIKYHVKIDERLLYGEM